MAALQLRNQSYRVLFRYRGKQHSLTLGRVSEREAESWLGSIDKVLLRLEQNLLSLPEGTDIVTFVRHDGEVPEVAKVAQEAREPIKLSKLIAKYVEVHRGSMEESSLKTAKIHLSHFLSTLGKDFPITTLSTSDLQSHIDKRKIKSYHDKPISPATLKKEIAALRTCWNWGVHHKHVAGPFPSRGLRYPKGDAKPAFMTWAEIGRKIEKVKEDGRGEAERDALWDCLFLTLEEIAELLEYVRTNARQPWIYPAVAFAAHTGARRSEILRVEVSDLDLESKTVTISEKKRSHKQRTQRRVPVSAKLERILRDWLAIHPGGSFLFCNRAVVSRSKKRSPTTGHRTQKVRPKSKKDRMATVRRRSTSTVGALTKDEARHHFEQTLKESRWKVLKGWHVLRHSFCSNCAARGIDQRLIDAWVGHQTEEMRKRYRHLLPSTEQEAISSVFGGQ